MNAVIQETNLDAKLTALFSQINNRLFRCKSEIEVTKPFTDGTGAFEYKHAYDREKPFTVTGSQNEDNPDMVNVVIVTKNNETLSLPFNTARNAFCTKCPGIPLSVESTQKLQSFLMALN